MSKDNLNQVNFNYNLDKLNFGKIRKELDMIPQIIRNHNKIGLRSCISATNIYSHKNIFISNNSNKEIFELDNRNIYNIKTHNPVTLKKSKSIQIKDNDDINIISNTNNNINLNSRTFHNNSLLSEEDIFIQIK